MNEKYRKNPLKILGGIIWLVVFLSILVAYPVQILRLNLRIVGWPLDSSGLGCLLWGGVGLLGGLWMLLN